MNERPDQTTKAARRFTARYVSEYVLDDERVCGRCGGPGIAMTERGLAYIVRCRGCGNQTGLERCEADAIDAWRKLS